MSTFCIAFPDGIGQVVSGTWGDCDNDGVKELYLLRDTGLIIFRREAELMFLDVTVELGLNPNLRGSQISLLDYDGDGFEDIILEKYTDDSIYHNLAGSGFEEIVLPAIRKNAIGASTEASGQDTFNSGRSNSNEVNRRDNETLRDIMANEKNDIFWDDIAYTMSAQDDLQFALDSEFVSWGEIVGTLSNQVDLQVALDSKVDSWGEISGILSDQSDLQSALDAKADVLDSALKGALVFGMANSKLTIPTEYSDDFWYGTDSFVIDFWVKFDSIHGSWNNFYAHEDYISINHNFTYDAGSTRIEWWIHGNERAHTDNWTPVIGQWYHIAGLRSGNGGYRIFIDGVSRETMSQSYTYHNPNFWLTIGNNWAGTRVVDGKFDEFRISKGTDRGWSGGFTPPTTPYEVDEYTVLLIHGDVDISDETGKTVQNQNVTLDSTEGVVTQTAVAMIDTDGSLFASEVSESKLVDAIDKSHSPSIFGSGAPSAVTPDYIGQIYVDTTGGAFYISYGTGQGDWQQLSTS